MNILNNVADALRRVAGVSTVSPQMALNRIPGISPAISRVDTVLGSVGMHHDATVSRERLLAPEHAEAHGGQPHPPGGGDPEPRRLAVAPERIAKPAVIRPGRSEAHWENPIISAAIPVLLRLDQLRLSSTSFDGVVRSQLALELRLFRDRLAKAGRASDVVADASYLMCTYVDEVVNDAARLLGLPPYNGEPSLLVEFHGDAWGGEDAFADLERWAARTPVDLAILEFYELVLSLGWEGRYRVIERGHVLLGDLRSQLHASIWSERQLAALAAPMTAVVTAARKRRLTVVRMLGGGICALLALYAAWIFDLDRKGRPIREALAAWDPPMHTISLAETLPPPLPRLLSEGWITARKRSQGWLLTFKSDRAFDVGQANFRPEFRHQLDRLGGAFAPWPGDLEVVGHSDVQPIKTRQFSDNLALSQERARVVAQALLHTAVAGGAGAPATAMAREITWSGKGDTEPVDPARTQAAYERNRRVEILWKVANLGPQSPRAVER